MKQALRSELRQRRKSIDPIQRETMNQAINQALLERVEHSAAACLAAFWPFDGEPDLRPALKQLSGRGLKIALPVIIADPPVKSLRFRAWHHTSPLVKNAFGIEEPAGDEDLDIAQFDLVFVPLLAWDKRGYRLGMGAGYYDRALAAVAQSDHPRRVGIAYEVQQVPLVPTDPWDIGMHEMITENGWFTCTA